jgi:hypothetical protein
MQRTTHGSASGARPVLAVLAVVMAVAMAGCGGVVMLNKMLFGDPVVDCAFKNVTGVDLTEGGHKVVVVCTAPAAVRDADMTGIAHQLVEDVSRHMRRQGVELVNSNKVRTWMDDNGGVLDDPRDLASEFDADYIFHIDMQQVSFYEDNSPDLYRGHAAGEITAFEVVEEKGKKSARQTFVSGFSSTYPSHAPVPAVQVDSARIFQRRFLERVAVQLSQMLYDHRASDAVF